jgi:TPR repeat protein
LRKFSKRIRIPLKNKKVMKRAILRRTKMDLKKTRMEAAEPQRFLLDAPPISAAALLKAARMGMAWGLAMVVSISVAQASSNRTTSFKATHALAAAGDAAAQCNLASMYEYGEGTTQGSSKAVVWYRKAAEQGLAVAQYNLARMYSAGEGVEQNQSKTVEWLQKAAGANYMPAWNRLGVIYERGEGAPKNSVEAYKFYTLAAQSGHIAGVVNRDQLKNSMTAEQIAEAEILVAQRTNESIVKSLNRHSSK